MKLILSIISLAMICASAQAGHPGDPHKPHGTFLFGKPLGCADEYCRPPKVVIPKLDVREVKKTVYDCKCVDFALPKCGSEGCRPHCDPCHKGCGKFFGCLRCGKPRVKKVLIKKYVKYEEPYLECEVEDAPCHFPHDVPLEHPEPVLHSPRPVAK